MQDSSIGHKYIPTYVCKLKRKKNGRKWRVRGSGYSPFSWLEMRLSILRIIYSSRWLLKFKSHKQVLTLVNKLFLTQGQVYFYFKKRKTANCFYLTGKYIFPLWAPRSQKVVILSPRLISEKCDMHLVVSSYQEHSGINITSAARHTILCSFWR